MKHILNFYNWISESTDWKSTKFDNKENDVADIAEQELLTNELSIIPDDDPLYDKLAQLADVNEHETVLEISGHVLEKFTTPIEFIQWNKIGGDNKIIETTYIIKNIDKTKI